MCFSGDSFSLIEKALDRRGIDIAVDLSVFHISLLGMTDTLGIFCHFFKHVCIFY